jgi:hypothetical protein
MTRARQGIDKTGAAKPHVAAFTMGNDSEQPMFCAARTNNQIGTVSIWIPSLRIGLF